MESIRERLEDVISPVIDEARKEVERLFDELLKELVGELDRELKESLRLAEIELRRGLYEARAEVRRRTSLLELEHKRRIQELKSAAVDEVLKEAMSDLPSVLGDEGYQEFMTYLLRAALRELGGDVTIVPADLDKEVISKALITLGGEAQRVKVSYEEALPPPTRGFLAVSREGKVTLRMTLDELFESLSERLKAVAARTLFKPRR